jgi:hypothetical protein
LSAVLVRVDEPLPRASQVFGSPGLGSPAAHQMKDEHHNCYDEDYVNQSATKMHEETNQPQA